MQQKVALVPGYSF